MQDIVKDRLPSFTPEQAKLVKGSSDYFGINQYTTYYISDKQTPQQAATSYSSDWSVQYNFQRNGVPIGQLAHSVWLYIVPTGMYGVVNYLKEKYQNPTIIISENGMDQPGNLTREEYLHDTVRVDFYKNYLTELKKGIDGGANVVAYFAWSLLDNFEWLSGYTSTSTSRRSSGTPRTQRTGSGTCSLGLAQSLPPLRLVHILQPAVQLVRLQLPRVARPCWFLCWSPCAYLFHPSSSFLLLRNYLV